MSTGGGGGNTTTTQKADPWGPQQPYLGQIFNIGQTLWNQNQANNPVQVSPLYNSYINAALGQATSPLPQEGSLQQALYQGLNTNSMLFPFLQSISNVGMTPNAMLGQAQAQSQQAAWDQGHSGQLADVYDQAMGSAQEQISGRLPILHRMQLATGNQWASPYASALGALGQQAAYNPYAQALGQASGAGNPYIPGVGSAAGEQMNNPFIGSILAAGGQGNQYIPQSAAASMLAMDNPALSQLQQTAAGDFLTPDTNPYLKQAVDAAQRQAMANIASQFNQGGRYGSGMMGGIQARELGDIAATAYSNQYERERANQLAAQQAIGSQYLQGVGQLQQGLGQAAGLQQQQQGLGLGAAESAAGLRQQGLAGLLSGLTNQAQLQQGQQGLGLQGLGQAGQLYATGQGQNIGAMDAAANLAGLQQQLQLQGLGQEGSQYADMINQLMATRQQAADISQNQVQNELASTALAGQLSGQDLQRWLDAQVQAGQGAAAFNQQQLAALGLAPQVQGMYDNQLAQLANAAQIQQQIMQLPEQQQWERLANYLASVQGNYGGTGSTSTPYYTNQAGGALGGALGGGTLGMALGGPVGAGLGGLLGGMSGWFSSRAKKTPHGEADAELIAERAEDMPVEFWTYRSGDPRMHIGPYAEDFQDRFGVGDGQSIAYSDAIGVLFVLVKMLLRRVRHIERNPIYAH